MNSKKSLAERIIDWVFLCLLFAAAVYDISTDGISGFLKEVGILAGIWLVLALVVTGLLWWGLRRAMSPRLPVNKQGKPQRNDGEGQSSGTAKQ